MADAEPLRIRWKGRVEEDVNAFWLRAKIELLESSASEAEIMYPYGNVASTLTREEAISGLESEKIKLEKEFDSKKFLHELEKIVEASVLAKKRLDAINAVLKKVNASKQETPAN